LLDVRNENLPERRIHQICAWTPARCRVGERLVARARPCVADRRFPAFRLLSHCYFLGARRRRERQSAALRTTPDCRRRLTSWRHDESGLGPARTCAAEKKKFHGLGDGRHCFRLILTMRVVADQGLQLQPMVEREDDRRQRAKKAQADLSSSSRSTAREMTRHIPYRTARVLAFLRLR